MLERIAYVLFPTLLLENTPWYSTWIEQERHESVFLWRLFFPIVGLDIHRPLLLVRSPYGFAAGLSLVSLQNVHRCTLVRNHAQLL